jgi:hypothetical protein
VISPGSLSPIVSFFCYEEFPHPSESLVETEVTQETKEKDHDDPEPAGEVISEWNTPLISCSAQV